MNLFPCFKPQQKLKLLMPLRPRLTRDVSGLPFSSMSTDIKSTFQTSDFLTTPAPNSSYSALLTWFPPMHLGASALHWESLPWSPFFEA